MRKSIPFLTSILAVLILSAGTCKKPLVCTGDCYDLHINGTTVDAFTGTPVPNVQMTLYRSSYGAIFNSKRKVIDFKSDANGRINATASIDTSVLGRGYFFQIEGRDDPNWVTANDQANDLFDLAQNPYTNFRPRIHGRGNIDLQLQKVNPGDFTMLNVTAYCANVLDYLPWSVTTPKDILETRKRVITATNTWTYISISRTDASGNSTFTRDSLFLTNNKPVTYIVKY